MSIGNATIGQHCNHMWEMVEPIHSDSYSLDPRFLETHSVVMTHVNKCRDCNSRRAKFHWRSIKPGTHGVVNTGWTDWMPCQAVPSVSVPDPVAINMDTIANDNRPPLPGLSEASKVKGLNPSEGWIHHAYQSSGPLPGLSYSDQHAKIKELEAELAKAHLSLVKIKELESFKEGAEKELIRACNAEKELYGQVLHLQQEVKVIAEDNAALYNNWVSSEKMVLELKADIRMYKSKWDYVCEQLRECQKRLAEQATKTLAEQARAKLSQQEVNALFAHYAQLEKDRKEGKS